MNERTAPELGFTVEIDATSDLPSDADRVEALITIAAFPTGGTVRVAQAAEILIMDRSSSMRNHNKIDYARRAACAAIEILPDGTFFGIIGGNHTAEQVFPPTGGLARVDAAVRAAAQERVRSLRAKGGTKIGQWLAAANEFFATGPTAGVIRHAVLYSDGENLHETREELDEVLRACAGRFICDVRGLGDEWGYAELLHIAQQLGGDADAVSDAADLPDDLTARMRWAARLAVTQAYLRLTPDSRFRVESVSQMTPAQAELERTHWRVGETTIDIPLGPWHQETRCYRLTLRFQPDSLPETDEVRATPVELLAETAADKFERRANAALVVRRHAVPGGITARPGLTQVAKMRELTSAIAGCADAWFADRPDRKADVDDELNRAVRLATELGDNVRLRLLDSVAVRSPGGRWRLRPDVTRGEMLKLGMNSTKTGVPPADLAAPPPASGLGCPTCGETTYGADLRYCESCGAPLHGKAGS